jgi:hypothetical protein
MAILEVIMTLLPVNGLSFLPSGIFSSKMVCYGCRLQEACVERKSGEGNSFMAGHVARVL